MPVPTAARTPQLTLLGEFNLIVDDDVAVVPHSGQRVLALLAVQGRPLRRQFVAGILFESVGDERAGASVRSALWRLGRVSTALIETSDDLLQLAPHVVVDLRDAYALSELLITAPEDWQPIHDGVAQLSADLLPGWYEEWVVVERERFRQVRLHALDTLCIRLTHLGRFSEATQAGVASVAGEPLRESAQRALIGAYLAEGNQAEAIRQYQSFATLLQQELDRTPPQELYDLVFQIRP